MPTPVSIFTSVHKAANVGVVIGVSGSASMHTCSRGVTRVLAMAHLSTHIVPCEHARCCPLARDCYTRVRADYCANSPGKGNRKPYRCVYG